MSRTHTVELCGETLHFPVTFEAGERLANAGYDPLEAALGKPIKTARAIIAILHVGAQCAGSKLTRQKIGEHVFDRGAINFLADVNEYLALFVDQAPEHPVSSGNGDQ